MYRCILATFAPARTAALLISGLLLSGCQTFGTDGLVRSSAPSELAGVAASDVAGDLVPRLAEQIGTGKATIVLKTDGSDFGAALESSLRTWGYAVTTDRDVKDAKAIRLAYVVAPLDGQLLARLSTDSVELGRIYTTTAAGAVPASPVSVMRRS